MHERVVLDALFDRLEEALFRGDFFKAVDLYDRCQRFPIEIKRESEIEEKLNDMKLLMEMLRGRLQERLEKDVHLLALTWFRRAIEDVFKGSTENVDALATQTLVLAGAQHWLTGSAQEHVDCAINSVLVAMELQPELFLTATSVAAQRIESEPISLEVGPSYPPMLKEVLDRMIELPLKVGT